MRGAVGLSAGNGEGWEGGWDGRARRAGAILEAGFDPDRLASLGL